MRRFAAGTAILLIGLASIPAVAQRPHPGPGSDRPLTQADIRRMLPSGRLRVDVMALQFPERMSELALKVKASLDQHPDWLKAHQEEFMRPNKMAPFSPELGLTRSEYSEFVAMMEKGADLVKVADGAIDVKQERNRIALDGRGDLAFLKHVVIDLAADRVITPYATLKTRTVFKPQAHQPGGMWNGIEWKLQTGPPISSPFPPATATSISLTVGKYLDGKRGNLMYGVTIVENRKMLAGGLLMLRFAIPR